jgi:hypothetical protein
MHRSAALVCLLAVAGAGPLVADGPPASAPPPAGTPAPTPALAAPVPAPAPPSGQPAGDARAAEILRAAEEIRNPETDYALEFTLRTVNPASAWKERTSRYTMIAHGKDHALVLMHQPAQFYPGTLMIARGLYWFLLPKAEKPLQLSAQNVLEGDISYGDLARGNLVRNYTASLDGEEKVGGARCWRLELTRTGYEANYPRIRCWVEKRSYRPRKFEYYGKTGSLLKTALYEEYQKTRLGLRPVRIEVTSPGRPDETTTLLFADLRPLDLSQVRFTIDGLVAFRDAARSRLGADGTQSRVEDLIVMLGRDGS